jgi:hypothetical protein
MINIPIIIPQITPLQVLWEPKRGLLRNILSKSTGLSRKLKRLALLIRGGTIFTK